MDDNIKKLREALDYARSKKNEIQNKLDEATGSSEESGGSGGSDTDTKDLHDESLDAEVAKKQISFLDDQIKTYENALEQIEELNGKNLKEENEEEQEEVHGRGGR